LENASAKSAPALRSSSPMRTRGNGPEFAERRLRQPAAAQRRALLEHEVAAFGLPCLTTADRF
jgi:hypothetical protein